jgi:hypothetical protein
MSDQSDTFRLKVEQVQRELAEQRLAEASTEQEEVAQHARRADKASYLRAKLEERERSEAEEQERSGRSSKE